MNKKRLKGYESPTTELIELRVEGVICQSNNLLYGDPGQPGGGFGDGGSFNL